MAPRPRLSLLTAVFAVLAALALGACGSSAPEDGLTSEQAEDLVSPLENLKDDFDRGDCDGAQTKLASIREDIAPLEDEGVGEEIVADLERLTDRLEQLLAQCEPEEVEPTTTTTTEPAPTTTETETEEEPETTTTTDEEEEPEPTPPEDEGPPGNTPPGQSENPPGGGGSFEPGGSGGVQPGQRGRRAPAGRAPARSKADSTPAAANANMGAASSPRPEEMRPR